MSGKKSSSSKNLAHRAHDLRALVLSQLENADPSTLPFLRAWSLGFIASVLPGLLRILLGLARPRKSETKSAPPLRALWQVIGKALSLRGLAMALGTAVGGAKWAESRLEPLVRLVLQKWRAGTAGKRKVDAESQVGGGADEEDVVRDGRIVKAVSTFLGGTLASLVSISLLQSSPDYSRQTTSTSTEEADASASPYPSLSSLPPDATPIFSSATQSPTLDITLFLFVRAVDSLARGMYEWTDVASGKYGAFWKLVSSQADTAVFWISTYRIMWCWFYIPSLLPPSYVRWISALARIDSRLLRLLQYARNGEYVYGKTPKADVAEMSAQIASNLGKPPSFVLPDQIQRLDCYAVHGKLGGNGSCEMNAARRWTRAFFDALAIYLPVHFVPHLLFGLKALLKHPGPVITRILLAASRSSAFLATFVASIFASVCLVRTRLPGAFPSVPQQPLDGGWATQLGCFMCGFSVLIENKRRRREMALYCAPRALFTVMDEIAPAFLTQGATGEFASRWIERWLFALSSGVVIAASVHQPRLVSGVVRGVMRTAIGDWGRSKKLSE